MPQRKPETRKAVANALRERITAGEWPPGVQLPTVRELAEECRCSHVTAHAALQILATEGLVVVRQRQRTTVAWPTQSIAGPRERLARSVEGSLFRPGEEVEMLRTQLVVDTNPDALEAFGLPEDAQLGLREYLVRSSGIVVTYGASFIHPEVWGAVPELQSAGQIPDGIIGAVRRATGRRAVAVPSRHKADYATVEEAERLGIAEDAPVLVEITECVDGAGLLVEWNLSVHPARHWVGQ